jgi:hypothetical protein
MPFGLAAGLDDGLLYSPTEHLISPSIVHVLHGKVRLVGAVVSMSFRIALSQGEKDLQTMSPLGLTFTRH